MLGGLFDLVESVVCFCWLVNKVYKRDELLGRCLLKLHREKLANKPMKKVVGMLFSFCLFKSYLPYFLFCFLTDQQVNIQLKSQYISIYRAPLNFFGGLVVSYDEFGVDSMWMQD